MKKKLLMMVLFISSNAFALSDPPPPGPTVTDYANAQGYVRAAIISLGTIAGLVLGGFFSFWLIRKAMNWANNIDGISTRNKYNCLNCGKLKEYNDGSEDICMCWVAFEYDEPSVHSRER